jgi:hypothetical protein
MRYAAERRNLAESIAELHEIADGRDHVFAEAAGITAGSWYAWPSTHVGYELVAAGMLIMAGGRDGEPLDRDELERWTRVGCERVYKIPAGGTVMPPNRNGRQSMSGCADEHDSRTVRIVWRPEACGRNPG